VTLHLEEDKLTPAASQPQATQARGRRTATQLQLNALPHVLEAEQLAGNQMPAIADHWACMNTRCRNKGKTCWRSKKPGAPDIADDHYPVPTDLFRRWSKEVNDEVSTVEQPSPQLIIALCKWKERSYKKAEVATKTEEQSASATAASTTSALLNTFLITQLKQMNQQSLSSLAVPSSLPHGMPTASFQLCILF
jgi:hypothetical protein